MNAVLSANNKSHLLGNTHQGFWLVFWNAKLHRKYVYACVYRLHLLLYFKSLELKLLNFPLGYLFIVAEQCVCVCMCVRMTTTLICIWNVRVLMLCVYDISVCRLVMWRSEPPCWPAAWPVYTLWSFGWKSGDESINFLCSLSSSHWNCLL